MTQSPAGLLCPVCRVDLVMSERQGVEIDYCPKCRGVWLDRGELDKILERGASESGARADAQARPQPSTPSQSTPQPPPPGYQQPYQQPYPPSAPHDPRYARHDSDEYPAYGRPGYTGYPRHKKRRSFLDDIFDFD